MQRRFANSCSACYLWLAMVLLSLAATLTAQPQPPAASESFSGTNRRDDPLPIRRLRVSPTQLPVVLKQLELGPLRRMPRGEFEQLLQEHRRLAEENRRTPVLSELRLTATLQGDDLVGRAEWDIYNPGNPGRLMLLEPLRAAVSGAVWSDGRPAVFGTPAGSPAPAVWIERTGLQTLRCDWSAAGLATLDERRFELRWPLATTAVLELDLPLGLVPVAGDAIIVGPLPANSPRQQRWRIRFSGRNRLDLTLRPAAASDTLTVAEGRCRYDVQASGCYCTYDFDLRPVRGHASSWTFQIDPTLQITDVLSTPRASWSVEAATSMKQPRTLRVTLPPASTARLAIQALTPPPSPGMLELPSVRPQQTLLVRETIDVRVAPEWKLEQFIPGDYRMTNTSLANDQSRLLTLQGHWLPSAAQWTDRKSPQLYLAPAEPVFAAAYEQLVWDLEHSPPRLNVRLRLVVKKGPLCQFRCYGPEGYELRRFNGGDALLISTDKKQRLATVEWLRPLTTGQTVDMEWEWAATTLLPIQGTGTPFPTFTPLSVLERHGLFAITAVSAPAGKAIPGPGAEPLGWFDWDVPFPPPRAKAVFRYRGTDIRGYWLPAPSATHAVSSSPPSPEPRPLPEKLQPLPLHVSEAYQILLPTIDSSASFFAIARVHCPAAKSVNSCPLFVTVELSSSAQLEAVRLDGRWLSPISCETDQPGQWRIPLPGGTETVTVVLRGRVQPEQLGLWRRLDPPVLSWSGTTVGGDCFVRLPQNYAAIFPVQRGAVPPLLTSLPSDVVPLLDVDGANWLIIPAGRSLWYGSPSFALAVAFGLIGLFLVLLVSITSMQTRRWFRANIVVASAIMVVALLLPGWWQWLLFPTGAIVALLQLGLTAVRNMGTRPVALAILVAGGTLSPIVFPSSSLLAQHPEPFTVLLLPPDINGQEEVLVPLALLDRLNALRPTLPAWVLTEAHYQTSIEGLVARVEARFVIHVLEQTEATFLLPLGEGRLEGARIHDVPAYLTLVRPGLYALPLPGRGRQEIHVRFVLNIAGNAERELRFGTPECPHTMLAVQTETTLRQLQLPARLGRWTVQEETKPKHMQAELGSVRQVLLRWREEGKGTANLRVRECCLWELHPQGADLTAAWWLEVVGGSLTRLELRLPAELEATAVSVRSPESGDNTPLRDWILSAPSAGWRTLRIDLRTPVSGRWLLVIQAVPRYPPSRQPLLRFPWIVLPQPAESDSFYVLRLKDTALEGLHRQGVIDFTPDALYPLFDTVAELRLGPAQSLRVFRPIESSHGELRPLLRLPTEPYIQTHTTWQIGWRGSPPPSTAPNSKPALIAFAAGVIRWKNSATPGLVELVLPAVVEEIRGQEVVAWSQRQGVVQVWLRRPLTEGTLQWYGRLQPALGTPLDLPLPRPSEPATLQEQWEIHSMAGLAVAWERLRGWTLAEPPASAALTPPRRYTAETHRQPPPLPRLSIALAADQPTPQ